MNTSAMQNRRVLLGGGLVVALLIVAAAWLLFIHPKLSSASSLRSQADSVQLQADVLRSKNTELKKQSLQLSSLRAGLSDALAKLPSDSGLPAFTNQLSTQAAAHSVELSSVTVGGISAAGSASSATSTATTTAPVVGGLYQIKVTIVTDGVLADQLAFLKAVEQQGPRSALITSTQFSLGAGARVASVDGESSATTQLTIFSSPRSPQESAALQKLLNG